MSIVLDHANLVAIVFEFNLPDQTSEKLGFIEQVEQTADGEKRTH